MFYVDPLHSFKVMLPTNPCIKKKREQKMNRQTSQLLYATLRGHKKIQTDLESLSVKDNKHIIIYLNERIKIHINLECITIVIISL